MTPEEIQQTLQAGIDAVKRGQKRRARECLLNVIQADERNESAWLWLSAAVESLDDQITALENVVEINPKNQAALKGLEHLRAKLAEEHSLREPQPEPKPAPVATDGGEQATIEEVNEEPEFESAAPEPEAEPTLAALEDELTIPVGSSAFYSEPEMEEADSESLYAPVAPVTVDDISQYADLSPIESVSNLDDLNQCVYCGAIVAPELKNCPECKRSLVTKEGKTKLSGSLRNTIFVACISIALAAVSAIFISIAYSSGEGGLVKYVFGTLGLDFIFGNYATWNPALTPIVMWAQIGLSIAMVLAVLGLAYQVTLAYYGSVLIWSLNVLWVAFRWVNSYTGPALAVADVLASLVCLFFIFASQPDFQVNLVRVRCMVDPHIKGGDSLHKLGLIYKQEGRWALAVAHWRAAIAAMPGQSLFYKDLAVGYAQIGYYQRALRTLDEFARQKPDDPDIPTMRTLIEEKRAADKKPKD